MYVRIYMSRLRLSSVRGPHCIHIFDRAERHDIAWSDIVPTYEWNLLWEFLVLCLARLYSICRNTCDRFYELRHPNRKNASWLSNPNDIFALTTQTKLKKPIRIKCSKLFECIRSVRFRKILSIEQCKTIYPRAYIFSRWRQSAVLREDARRRSNIVGTKIVVTISLK